MQRRQGFKVLAILVAALGLLLGILGAGSFFETLSLSNEVKLFINHFVSYAAVVTGAGILFVLLILAVRPVQERVTNWYSKTYTFTFRTCRDDDVREISVLAKDMFGDMATSFDQTKRLFELNPAMFQVLVDQYGKVRGYYCMFRLSKAGTDAIERGDFSILHMPKEYMRLDNKKSRNHVYVGALFGSNNHARAYIVASVLTTLRAVRPKIVYARAATKDGLRLLENYKFRPVVKNIDGMGKIYYKNDPRFGRVNPAARLRPL